MDQLLAEASAFGTDPYLVTVTADSRPHCAVVVVEWDVEGGGLVVRAPSSWGGSVSSGHRQVTLLWSPPEPGGYSLIVDGTAGTSVGPGSDRLCIVPTRAVLHRPGPPPSAGGSCGADCLPILGV
ncbi:MAG: hypothetical protein ACRDXC_14125 [Acidimicrobiales bacterium]